MVYPSLIWEIAGLLVNVMISAKLIQMPHLVLGLVLPNQDPVIIPALPIGNLKKQLVALVGEHASVGSMRPVVVNAVVLATPTPTRLRLLLMALPARSLKRPPAVLVEELVKAGTTGHAAVCIAVQAVPITQLHLQVMDHVRPVNTGTVLPV